MFWLLQSNDIFSAFSPNKLSHPAWATTEFRHMAFCDSYENCQHCNHSYNHRSNRSSQVRKRVDSKRGRERVGRERERERGRNGDKVGRRVWENWERTMWGKARERREMREGEMGVIEIDVCWFNHAELILRNGNIEEFWDIYRKRSPIFLIPITIHTPFGKKNSVTLPITKLWRMLGTIL